MKLLACLALLVGSLSAPLVQAQPVKAPGNIVEVATANGSFTTLLKAAKAADLVDTLSTTQGLTLFAPTDTAFAALPPEALKALLDNKDALRNVLLYHVIGSEVPASTAVTLTKATMLNGQDVTLKVVDGALFVNNAKVIEADVPASNGIIHVIDAVLMPK